MSVTALRPEDPPRLLHPLWCVEEPPHADDAPHRGRQTCWEVGDVRFTLNLIRWDDPRYLNGHRDAVDGRGRPAPEPCAERVELTITSTALENPDGSPIQVEVDFTADDGRLTVDPLMQSFGRLGPGLMRDYPRQIVK